MRRYTYLPRVSGALILLLLTSFAGWMIAENALPQLSDNALLKELRKQYTEFTSKTPLERIYVQSDKSLYKPGETIWFQAYLLNESDMKASAQSDIIHVELINPKGTVERQINMIAKNGSAGGDFQLSPDQMGGIYKIKAYTSWQKNFAEELLFEKELTVQQVVLPRLKMKLDFEKKAYGPGDKVKATLECSSLSNQPLSNNKTRYIVQLDGNNLLEKETTTDTNGKLELSFSLPKELSSPDGLLNVLLPYQGQTESISRSIPIVLNKISLSFYPEGGDMVTNLENAVAFQALNEFDKPADIEGYISDETGKAITRLSSYHQGMGRFMLKPEAGKKYSLHISRPEGITESYPLPEALPRGYSMSIAGQTKNSLSLQIKSTEEEEMSIVAQQRGSLVFNGAFKARAGSNTIEIPLQSIPMGVLQITLFDSKGVERAERLAFVSRHKQMKIAISTDKEQYQPREQVQLTIHATDERGVPIPGNLSLAVVDDKLLSFADDRQGTILSRLLLEPELRGKVEEPNFYFDPKEPKADSALDLLMMTRGWRHFTWKQVREQQLPGISFQKEKTLLSGIVTDGTTGKPIIGALVTAKNGARTFAQHTNAGGHYAFHKLDLTEPVMVEVEDTGHTKQAFNVYQYSENQNVVLYDPKRIVIYDWNMNGERMEFAAPQQMNEVQIMRGGARNVMRFNVDGVNKKLKKKMKAEDVEKEVPEEPEMDKAPEDDWANVKMPMAPNADTVNEGSVGNGFFKQNNLQVAPQQTQYYRSREFPAIDCSKSNETDMRTDFRSTIFWKGNVELDRNGKATLSFCNSDEVTSFRATVEGIGAGGLIGHAEKTWFTQLPFSLTAKIPVETAMGDEVRLPVTLTNNTVSTLSGELKVLLPESWSTKENPSRNFSLPANSSRSFFIACQVLNRPGTGKLEISFKSSGRSDAISQEVKTGFKGYPAMVALSGQEMEKEYELNINDPVEGTLQASLSAYPTSLSNMLSGLDAILQEPYGCFEQTSSSNYPNLLALQYMKENDIKDKKIMDHARELLDRGYKRLAGFETPKKGYEWFGHAPANEALTAYGLMEFNDMKSVYGKVDQEMVDRTAKWILARRDEQGGFRRDQQALDNFGRASAEVTNAYIVYALADAGYQSMGPELNASYNEARKSKDAYRLALVTNALFKLKDKRAEDAWKLLAKLQKEDGSWTSDQHSITYSMGEGLSIETTSLAMMAMLQSPDKDISSLNKAAKYLLSKRNSYGGFCSTQSTVMALKALTQFAKFSKRTPEDGTIEFWVDGKKVQTRDYAAGEQKTISLSGLEKYLTAGQHHVKVRYNRVKDPLPYSLSVQWRTKLPNTDNGCKVSLETKLNAAKVKVGETVRLTAILKNVTKDGLPMTMAILGIPGGVSAQPWQLKELQDKGVFDFYEITGNRLAIYYRQMKPSETRTIELDLKAEVPGRYESPASSAYLYYTNEFKYWTAAEGLEIRE